MNTAPSKVCPYCAESVKLSAKVCPFCKQWLTLWSFWNPAIFFLLFSLCAALIIFKLGHDLGRELDKGVDFSPFRGKISVLQSRMSFRTNEDKETELNTILVVTNQSELSWKHVEVEVRFYNHGGELIDVEHEWSPGIIYPHEDSAWRISTSPARPISEYESNAASVCYATDGRAYAY